MMALKPQAIMIVKTQQEISRLKRDIASSETDLLATGSTKTRDDVQLELDGVKADLYVPPPVTGCPPSLMFRAVPLSVAN